MPRYFTPLLRASVLVAAALSLPLTAHAQDARVKIGVVDLQRALTTSKEGKATKAKLEAEVNKAQAQLDEMSKKLQKLQEDVDKQRLTLKDDALADKQREIESTKKDAVRYRSDVLDELKRKEGEAAQRILKALADIVQRVAKDDGYSLVFESHNLLYSDNAYDLTDKLIQRFDAEGMPAPTAAEGKGSKP
ncbi:MAG: OmpH family outer membrane protein [Deltaproteobacteria bacterium]|nr:OmpH family outer membrane protein [Deltaproteobacteria bacterium]